MSDRDPVGGGLYAGPSAAPDHLQPAAVPTAPAPPAQRSRIRLALIVALVVVVGGGIAIVASSGSSTTRTPSHPTSPAAPSAGSGARAAQRRLAAVIRLMQQRSQAILHRHRAEFMATIDPRAPAFRRREAAMFADLAKVPLASWHYTIGAGDAVGLAAVQRRYSAPVWSPYRFEVGYRLRGFDRRPTSLPQYPTFIERSGRWYLRSLTDFRHDGRGPVSATDVWDYGPVDVIRRRRVLVLGPPSQAATMNQVGDLVSSAIPRVTAVWGTDWSQRVVVVVPSTQRELALLTADHQDLSQIVALTSSEESAVPGRQQAVGDRVTINPRNWPALGALGARVVITHELTHVASRDYTGSQTPKWLAEGFADYVGFLHTGLPADEIAAELKATIRSGEFKARLPANHAFLGGAKNLSAAYEEGWLACTYIADHFGQRRLVQFYRAVGRSRTSSGRAVDTALRDELHLTLPQFVARWQAFVHVELG